jgi:hypothetical protein
MLLNVSEAAYTIGKMPPNRHKALPVFRVTFRVMALLGKVGIQSSTACTTCILASYLTRDSTFLDTQESLLIW